MIRRRIVPAALLACAVAAPTPAAEVLAMPGAEAPADPVIAAVTAELQRARGSLALAEHEPPYFISAIVSDYLVTKVAARYGALVDDQDNTDRLLEMTVRVGNRKLDNGRFIRVGRRPSLLGPEIPEDGTEAPLRRAVWLTVDEVYKLAVEDLSRKQAVLERQVKELAIDRPDDFSPAEVHRYEGKVLGLTFPRGQWQATARRVSAIFRGYPTLHEAEVEVVGTRRLSRYVDTDGSLSRHERYLVSFKARAKTQAADGMPLRDCVTFYATSPEELPDEVELTAAVRRMADQLAARAAAIPLEESYVGPVLLEHQAAAEFLVALAGHGAATAAEPVFEDPRMSIAFSRFAAPSPWAGRLGKRVTARSLDISDDPTIESFAGQHLIGSYAVDDEGVPPRPIRIVEHGILIGLLGTRTPTKGVTTSTGHARLPPGSVSFLGASRPVPGVLVVRNTDEIAVSPADVRARFLELVDEEGLDHGYLVRVVRNRAADPPDRDDASNNGRRNGTPAPIGEPYDLVRIALDGSETVVRGAEWGKLDGRALKEIELASSGDAGEAAYNLVTPIPGMAGLGAITTSIICPRALVIQELELVAVEGPHRLPPTLLNPLAGKP